MIELNDLFDYGLKIYQNSDYFKFSIDSLLLGEFVEIKKNANILDMCTGNCPVPLLLLTKEKLLHIDAVEVQEEVYNLAKKSIVYNKLDENINLINDDINKLVLNKKYDIITCNPPYFKVNSNKMQNKNDIKKIARHEVLIKLDDIARIASSNLKETGDFYLVHRPERMVDIINALNKYNLGIREICLVNTNDTHISKLVLFKASKNKKNDVKVYNINIKDLKSYKSIFDWR